VTFFRPLVLSILAGLSWEVGCSSLPGLPTSVDPVCGRRVVEVDAPATREYRGETYYFDTEACAFSFDARPEEYRRRAKEERPDPSLWKSDQGAARSFEVRDRE